MENMKQSRTTTTDYPTRARSRRVRRSTVYAVTAAAFVAMIGGFALATAAFSFTNTATQGQSGFSVVTGSTMWSFGSATVVSAGTSTCSTSPLAVTITTPGTSPATSTETIPGASGASCVSTDFAEKYAMSASVVTSPTSDVFTFFAQTATSSACSTTTTVTNSFTVTTSGGTSTATTVNVNFVVDYGAPSTTVLCNVQIAVSGN